MAAVTLTLVYSIVTSQLTLSSTPQHVFPRVLFHSLCLAFYCTAPSPTRAAAHLLGSQFVCLSVGQLDSGLRRPTSFIKRKQGRNNKRCRVMRTVNLLATSQRFRELPTDTKPGILFVCCLNDHDLLLKCVCNK